VRDAKSGYLWTALRWAAAALHQTERVYASLEPYLEPHRRRTGKGVIRLTQRCNARGRSSGATCTS
jgi:hypothetical protein